MNPLQGKNVQLSPNGVPLDTAFVGKTVDGKKVTVREKNELKNIDMNLIALEDQKGSLSTHRINNKSHVSNSLFSKFKKLFERAKKNDIENINDKIVDNQNKIDSHIQNLKRILPNNNVDKLVSLIKQSVFFKKIKNEAIKELIEPEFPASKEVIQILKKLIPLLLENRELIDESEGLESIASIRSESINEDSQSTVDSLEFERGFSQSEDVLTRPSRSTSLSSEKIEEPVRSKRIEDPEVVSFEESSEDEFFPFTKEWLEKNK